MRRKLRTALVAAEQEIAYMSGQIDDLNQRIRALCHQDTAASQTGSNVPFMLINSMPKSASVYILRTLAQSLSIRMSLENISHGFFPDYYLIPSRLTPLRDGRVVRQEHFDAKPINLRLLSRCTDRLVLHLRDPRQATLSWLHHANRLTQEHPDGVNYTIHEVPDGYLARPLHEQLDWQIETHLVSLVRWLQEWRSVLDCPTGIGILVTHYEDLIADESAFFARVLDFYEVPEESFSHKPAEKTIANNFRRGELDEWKRILSPAQKERCIEIMGEDLMARFGWEPSCHHDHHEGVLDAVPIPH